MLVRLVVEFGSAVYGSARKTQLKKLDSIHNKRLHIALGASCINQTQNLLIEGGQSTLLQRGEIKTTNMAVKMKTKPEHPLNQHLKNKKAYDQYGLRPSHKFAPCWKLTSNTLTRWSNRNTCLRSQTWTSILTQ
jgi:hypothetical protein